MNESGDEEVREPEIIAGYPVHPLASKWPLIVGQPFEDFVEAAALSGRLQPVEIHEGFLIDGRNRLRVQEELRRRGTEIDVPVVNWEPSGDETIAGHIWAVNAHRRHQTADQLAVLAASTFLPAIKAEREARQLASRFGSNDEGTAASDSTPPDGQAVTAPRTSAEKDAASSAGCLAALANVSIYKARQAIALHNAVEAGEVSKTEVDAVVAGDKPLSAALPRRKKAGTKKLRRDEWDEGDDEGDVTIASFDCMTTVGSSIEADIDRFWQALTDEIPVTEHRIMCWLLTRKIEDMEQQRGW